MRTNNLTLEERERWAYINGLVHTATLIGELEDAESAKVDAEEWIEDLGGRLRLSQMLDELDTLRLFFNDCFECLPAHYPCPSVTNDHDKSVIFDAIRRGSENHD